jgi:hypothetical protein
VRQYLIAIWMAAGLASAAEPPLSGCTLNTDHFLRQAEELAASKPGASLDPRTYTVTWIDAEFGQVSVSLGGCAHYGLSVTSTREASQPLSYRTAVRFASRMVRRTWPEPYSTDIANALLSSKGKQESRGADALRLMHINLMLRPCL